MTMLGGRSCAMQLRVDPEVPTRAYGNGTTFDITNILPYPVTVQGPGFPNSTYTYIFDPVHGVPCGGMPSNTAVCQHADFLRNCGLTNGTIWSLHGIFQQPTVFSVLYVDGFNWRMTNVTFIEDAAVHPPVVTVVGEAPYLEYQIQLALPEERRRDFEYRAALKVRREPSTVRMTLPGSCAHLHHSTETSSPHEGPAVPRSKTSWNPLTKDITAAPGFNRWLLVLPAVSTHMCLAQDWSLSDVVPIFSSLFVMHGLSAAILGKWQERVGPRVAGAIGACLFGGGFIVGSAGLMLHSLPLMYLGYGMGIGLGMGTSYVPPVATLLKWFPDRRGFATGLTIMGFGGGALVMSPIMTQVIARDGRYFVEGSSDTQEVIKATAEQLLQSPFPSLQEGFFLVGTGSTGVPEALTVMGLGYLAICLGSAFSFRLPSADTLRELTEKSPQYAKKKEQEETTGERTMPTVRNVHVDDVMRTPQFWQIWTSFGLLAATGMASLSIASTMLLDIFGKQLPDLVNIARLVLFLLLVSLIPARVLSQARDIASACASRYVLALSAANLAGRLVWASASDYVGRKAIFGLYTGVSIPLYASLPYIIHQATETQDIMPLASFVAANIMIVSFFGGAYSSTPAYEADMFGSRYAGAIHGRMLTASAAGGFLGPMYMTKLREWSEVSALRDLASKADIAAFESRFGVSTEQINTLIAKKSVDIQTLLGMCPAGTADPTPFLYDTAMYASAGLLGVAAVANLTMRPVKDAMFMKPDDPRA
ncbi:uncharacterized protein MONBRDRAFT_25635 [Monosiga brevicollis MX1]|uniref:Major facilitator superfamily (MFS) profile domain-containing protein n=1 Tax=Monosiga brevicollis TaxID=81824 RepID=A9UZZ3_MONBE|nr:uncharacterized protein MONBRDRAFT_25635 [Monosiga brevicollis MX1]EDQ89063.1 predicted protein [Monosiga brevicollis MX1]|eukprot:XP_001746168.1 hypothetical protein [Monosiga brevicollis MX1]